jgi:hypothetical protein
MEEIKDKKITDEYWEHVHNLDYLVANAKVDPEDTERHINFRVSDAKMMPRKEVERQHKAWHERQKTKEKVEGELKEVLAIIDDDSTDPEDLDMDEKQKKAMKKKLKNIAKKAFEQA